MDQPVSCPAVLIGIELYHPAGFTGDPGMYEYLSKPEPYNATFKALGYPGPQWWFTLHMIQTPMVALVGIGLLLMVGKVRGASVGAVPLVLAALENCRVRLPAVLHRAGISIGGFGLARSILITEQMASSGSLQPVQVEGVEAVLNATWTDHSGRRRRLVRKPDGIVGGVHRGDTDCPGSVHVPQGLVAAAAAPGGIRLGATAQPHSISRTDRVRAVDSFGVLDLVGRAIETRCGGGTYGRLVGLLAPQPGVEVGPEELPAPGRVLFSSQVLSFLSSSRRTHS